MMKSPAPLFLGLDLGGTNIKAGVVTGGGKLLGSVQIPTAPTNDLSAEAVIARLVDAAHLAADQARAAPKLLRAVGIVSPGVMDIPRGIVRRVPNLPPWRNVALARRIGAALRLPAVLENDARAAAFGEWWAGAGHGADPFILLTLGTGIGGGIIINGRLLHGATGTAGEIGHTIIHPAGERCGCGQHGCLERYCSAHFFAEQVTAQLARAKNRRGFSTLAADFKAAGKVTAEDIATHARRGDAFAAEAWDRLCGHLALACVNLCHAIDPAVIAFSGGMANADAFLVGPIRHHLRHAWWKISKPRVRIVRASLGNHAGMVGAAGIAKDAILSGRRAATGD